MPLPFPDFESKKTLRVIGLMSGTSCDGVDAALCEISGKTMKDFAVKLVKFYSHDFSSSLRKAVLDISSTDKGSIKDLCRLNFRIAQTFANAAEKVTEEAGLELKDIDLIGSHGQTVAHLPPRTEKGLETSGLMHRGSTLQLGEPAVIAEALRVPVVSNFRTRDMAAGGQGAPLVPYVDYILFSSQDRTRAMINLGGISNITYLPAGAQMKDILAFDAGPGNMIIDSLVSLITQGKQTFDLDGQMAKKGQVDGYILMELLKHPFLKAPPPKSTGREEFGMPYADKIYRWGIRRAVKPSDILRTVTDFTAIALVRAYKEFLLPRGQVDEVLVSGGGALNKTMMARMRKEFGEETELLVTDEIGMPLKAKEAICFAILARETVLGRPGNLPSATGAVGPRILGQITPV